MRIPLQLHRLCSTCGRTPQLFSRVPPPPSRRFTRQSLPKCYARCRQRGLPRFGTVLIAALAPGAFVELAETNEDDKTGEKLMLEASRQEIRDDILEQTEVRIGIGGPVLAYWAYYAYDTIATGLRFVHLVFIFLPVILTAPTIWLGRRIKNNDGARTGTLWWYSFLVKAMERAGPAFIKAGPICLHTMRKLHLTDIPLAWSMGRLTY